MRLSCPVHSFVISSLILVFAPFVASAAGTIEGTVTFWGDPGGATEVQVAAHLDPFGPPDATVIVSISGGAFSLPVTDGTFFVSVLLARDGNFGEPRPDDVLAWYDADGDGDRDTVTVSGGAATGVDIDLGFVYVDLNATGGANNGTSWADAFTGLQDGINAAVSGIEVWVTEGTYKPGTSRSDSFLTKSGVEIYGGFAGYETIRDFREWISRLTILSGEIGAAGATDNCYHVVLAEGSNPTAMLNGLTITRGYANGGSIDSEGGGVRARGGGLTLVNVKMIDNYAAQTGGGVMANLGGTVKAYNCRFINNQAAGGHGGGYYGSVASAEAQTLVNCIFTGNSAWRGGGIALESAGLQPELVNVSLSGNSAGGEGGGIFTYSTQAFVIENSIIWGNTGTNPQISFWTTPATVNYSIVQGGWAHGGTQILTDDPSFADPELRINLDSPAVDAGDSTAIPEDLADIDEDHWTDEMIDLDLDNYWRRENIPSVPDTGIPDDEGRTVDMGAYEARDPALIFWDGFESGDPDSWSNVWP
ncbi:MAG: right-handed parallel beta-helix repeat-containing protein [Acidobacteriota bacterium]